jgi:hypothetical protein
MNDQKIAEKLEKDIERVQKRSKKQVLTAHRKPILVDDSD